MSSIAASASPGNSSRQAIRSPTSIRFLITHLHSDHVLELGPLLHTAWTSSPKREIRVYGPPGLSAMVRDFFRLMDYDVQMRMDDEKQADPQGMFRTAEFTEGPVFEDDLVAVTALRVVHPPMDHVYALKIRSADSHRRAFRGHLLLSASHRVFAWSRRSGA